MSRVAYRLSDPFRPEQLESERRLEVLEHVQFLLRRAKQEHEAGNYTVRDHLIGASQWWLNQMWDSGQPCYRW